MLCENCGNNLPENAKFCGKCGAKVVVERTCAQCGNLLAIGDIFCMECGTRYEAEAARTASKAAAAKVAAAAKASAAKKTAAAAKTPAIKKASATAKTPATKKVPVTAKASAAFSAQRIARRSDFWMMGRECRRFDTAILCYGKAVRDFAFYEGWLYTTKVDTACASTAILRINQQTRACVHIGELDGDYGNVCGVNSSGIFLSKYISRANECGMGVMQIACVDFDGTLMGQTEIESEGRDENGYDIIYDKWTMIMDHYVFTAGALGVRYTNIKDGQSYTLYRPVGEQEQKYFTVGKVAADADHVYFSLTANAANEYPEVERNGKTYRLWAYRDEFWYRYDVRQNKIECLSSAVRDLRNLFIRPEAVCDEVYDEDECEWVENPKYVQDPKFMNIKTFDVAKGIMWTLEKDRTLVARNIKTKYPCKLPKWKMGDIGHRALVYFNGEVMLEAADYHTIKAYDADGRVQGIVGMGNAFFYNNRGHGGCENIIVEGEYVYGDFAATDKLLRFNIHQMNSVEPAPEADII